MSAVGRGTSLALRLVMKTTSLALIVSLVLAHAAPARAESVHVNRAAPVPAAGESGAVRIIVPHKPGAGSSLEDQRYAMREALSQNAKNFRGGDVIVISATVAVIILLGIIIIILLT